MGVIAFCLNCRETVDIRTTPVHACPNCGHAFPAELARDLELRLRPARPVMLTLQMVLGYLFGFISILSLPSAFQATDFSQLEQIGVIIPPLAAIPMGLLTLSQTVLLLWSSWALQRNQYRSRILLMWLIGSLGILVLLMLPWASTPGLARTFFWAVAVGVALTLPIGWWYLYRAKKVAGYYAALRCQKR